MEQRPILTNMETLQDFLVSQLKTSNRTISFFVGAGISIPSPSCLPSADNVIKQVIEALCIDPEMDTYQHNLADRVINAGIKMEVLFEIIQRNIGTKLNGLFPLFSGGEPNQYHCFLARMLEANFVKHVVTTNFDQLIEKACNVNLNVYATEAEHAKRKNQSLFKIHGTVDRPETIVAVLPQVSRGLGPKKNQLLKETFENICIVIGWGDDDIDLAPLFSEAEKNNLMFRNFKV